MKIALLVTVCLLLFTSCSPASPYPTDDTYHFETDSQYTFYTQGGFRNFAESEDGFYFTLNIHGFNYLFYADKKTMSPLPLCGKPNCKHYEEKETEKQELCNAFVPSTDHIGTIFYTNGKLYAIVYQRGVVATTKQLIEISLDGSVQKTLCSLDTIIGEISSERIAVHRGYLYVANNSYDENMNAQLNVWRIPLDQPNKEPENLCNLKKDKPLTVMDLKIYGMHLYFSTWDGERNYYHLDLRSKKTEQIFKDIATVTNNVFYDEVYNIAIMGDRLVTELIHMDDTVNTETVDNLKCELYTANLDGTDVKEWQDVPNAPYTADNQYFYKWSMYAGHFLNSPPFFRIYDKDWTLLVDYDPSEYISTQWDVYVSPGEFVFLFTDEIIYYFSKSEIPTGNITPKLFIDVSNVEGFMG